MSFPVTEFDALQDHVRTAHRDRLGDGSGGWRGDNPGRAADRAAIAAAENRGGGAVYPDVVCNRMTLEQRQRLVDFRKRMLDSKARKLFAAWRDRTRVISAAWARVRQHIIDLPMLPLRGRIGATLDAVQMLKGKGVSRVAVARGCDP